MQKKIALCLYGNFNNRLSQHSGKEGYEYIKEKILNNRNVDVFIHSWDLNNEATIKNIYGPLIKSSVFEKQIDFTSIVDKAGINREAFAPPGGQAFRTIENSLSFYYSRGKSIQLKKQFEEQQNIKYDIVICSRFDLAQMDKYNGYQDFKVSEIVFDDSLDMNYFYAAMWDQLNAGYTDMWYYSSSENMDKLSQFYDRAQTYYQADSKYLEVLASGWPDSNSDDEFSNEFFQKEKSTCLLKHSPSMGHNNHFMHKWFFIDVGLYLKSRFLPVYPNKFCTLVYSTSQNLEDWKAYFASREKYSRIVGPKYFLVNKKNQNIPDSYEQIVCDEKLPVVEQIAYGLNFLQKKGVEACLFEPTTAVLQSTIDYKQLKSAIKFVIRKRYGLPLRNGFDCIQLNKPTFSVGIRTISDKYIFWTPPFMGYLDLKVPSLWKIASLLEVIKAQKTTRPIDFKCGYIFAKNSDETNRIYPYKLL